MNLRRGKTIAFSFLIILAACLTAAAQSNHTITLDGSNDFNSGAESLSSENDRTAYMTWDATNLYIGIEGNPLVATDSNLYVVVDSDPQTKADPRTGNGNQSQPTNESGGATYPFRANAVYQFFGTGGDDGAVVNPAPGNKYSSTSAGGAYSSASLASGVRIIRKGGSITELAIPFSDIGLSSGAEFNVIIYVANSSSGGSNFAQWPTENSNGNNQTLKYFYTQTFSSGVTPNAGTRYSYRADSTDSLPRGTYGSLFFVPSSATTFNCNAATIVGYDLYIGNNATFTMGTNTAALSVARHVTIDTGGTLTLSTNSGGDLLVGGDWTRTGTFTPNNRQVTFNGTGAQSISGATSFAFLRVNKSSGTLTLGANTDVTASGSGALDLTSGLVDAGSNTLSVTHTAANAISGGSSTAHVLGKLARGLANGGGTYVFPVGSSNGYAPVTLTNIANVGSGLFTASTTGTVHPTFTNLTNRLNRYWTMTNGPDARATVTFKYLNNEVMTSGMVTEADFLPYRIFSASSITQYVGAADANADTLTFDADGTTNPITRPTSLGPTALAGLETDWTGGRDAPTVAKLAQADAYHTTRGNLLRWHSAFEEGNLGFRVYREAGRQRELVTPELIAGSALKYGANVRLSAGSSYSWWDEGGPTDGVYWIEDIALDGTREWHGPIKVSQSDDKGLDQVATSPYLSQLVPAENGTAANGLVRGYASALASSPLVATDAGLTPGTEAWQRQLRLAGGAAVKIGVTQTGWHRVTAAQLMAAGLSLTADARYLQLYVDGVQVPLAVTTTGIGSGLGNNGTLEFYGVALDTPETNTRTYWLVRGDTFGLRYGPPVRVAPSGGVDGERGATPSVAVTQKGTASDVLGDKGQDAGEATNAPSPQTVNGFAYTIERKDRLFYVPSLHNGPRDNMFGFVVSPTRRDIPLSITKLQAGGAIPATLELGLHGGTPDAHSIQVALNGQTLGTTNIAGTAYQKVRLSIPAGILTEGNNTLSLTALGGSNDISFTDYVRVTYGHRYEAENNQLLFGTGHRNRLTVNGFTSANVRVYDVTDNERPFEVAARVESDAGGYAVTLTGAMRGRTLLAVGADQILTPARVEANAPSTWTESSRAADLLIVTHSSFRSAIEPLAQARRGNGLRTEIIDVEDIYDEWSAGAHSVEALSNFLQWTTQNWQTAPRYVLFVGDASFDPRNFLGYGVRDYVPTATVDTSQLETASDAALVDFNNDGIEDLSVGRLPAQTSAQVELMVQKILAYQPVTQARALLVADRLDGYNFGAANQAIAGMLPANTVTTVINRQGQADSTVRTDLLAALNAGSTIVNYMGHASVETWMHANIFQSPDANGLTNGRQLPVIVMMSCLNGYFQDIYSQSLSEALMNAPEGGAAAVWSSSALTYASQQVSMNRAWFQAAFPANGPTPLLGDLTRAAKSGTNSLEVRRSWILFGDPTMRIR